MSTTISIKTKSIPEAKALLKTLPDKIITLSEEYPLHIGIYQKSVRGIEISKEDDGIGVRLCIFASKADFSLFRDAIKTIAASTQGEIYDEDDQPIDDIDKVITQEWIDGERLASLQMACSMINFFGSPVTVFGLLADFSIGPKLLSGLGIPLRGQCKMGHVDRLECFLCQVHWALAEAESANVVEVPNPNDEKAQPLSMSMVAIKDNKVEDFDYLPVADKLCFIDLDGSCGHDGCPTIIPMREAWKILPDDIFNSVDDIQFFKEETLSKDEFIRLRETAKRYMTPRIHWRPPFPGHGIDEGQDTFILMWNPAISSVTLDDFAESVPNMLTEYFNWSIWEHEKAGIGDHFFLVRCGEGNTGIVMSGVFDSLPYPGEDWSGKGRPTYYIDMIPNYIADPDSSTLLSTSQLQEAIPSFDWTGGHSGRLLSPEEAQSLETLWAEHLKENGHKADGIHSNFISREQL